jgi:hypothetical protein
MYPQHNPGARQFDALYGPLMGLDCFEIAATCWTLPFDSSAFLPYNVFHQYPIRYKEECHEVETDE